MVDMVDMRFSHDVLTDGSFWSMDVGVADLLWAVHGLNMELLAIELPLDSVLRSTGLERES